MRHYTTAFFCDKGKGPIVSEMRSDGVHYPGYIKISSLEYDTGNVVFHLADMSDLIRFKNSVIEAYEMSRRKNAC